MSQAIVTGGSGFAGGHLIRHLLAESDYEKVINVDYQAPDLQTRNEQRFHYINMDVRKPINPKPFKQLGCGPDTYIFNLAAICKIPGYPTIDYFHTNIKGAEHACKLAEDLEAKTIVFTSSVAPYGASEQLKTEESIPQPDNAYGSSKLAAEYIHRGWQEKKPAERNLVVLRPGIIFGKNENANFNRLYHSLKKGYFVYPGRKDTRKACVYVKDVVRACHYFVARPDGFQLYNLVYAQAPSIEAICNAITKYTDAGPARFTVPGSLLKRAASLINTAGKLTGNNFSGIHPDRVEKVMVSTNISGQKLAESDFTLQYSLEDGIREWFEECNRQFLK